MTALARQHEIKGGRKEISRWLEKWDGTVNSLMEEGGRGRHPILSEAEMEKYILKPIEKENDEHTAIHYPSITRTITTKTGKNISLRTVQRLGKEQLSVKNKHTKKRTANESKRHTHYSVTLSDRFQLRFLTIMIGLFFVFVLFVSVSCD